MFILLLTVFLVNFLEHLPAGKEEMNDISSLLERFMMRDSA